MRPDKHKDKVIIGLLNFIEWLVNEVSLLRAEKASLKGQYGMSR